MKRVLAPGWNAVVANWRPLVAIQFVCLLLVVGYYTLTPIQNACAVLARMRLETHLYCWLAVVVVFGCRYLLNQFK